MTALDLSLVETGLPKWVEGLVSDTQCEWLEKPRKHHVGRNANGQRIDLRFVSMIGIGIDTELTAFNAGGSPGSEIDRCVAGIRTLSIQLEATTRRQGLGGSAAALLSTIEGAAMGEDSSDVLAAMGLVIQSFGLMGMVPDSFDNRTLLRWSLPAVFGASTAIATPSTTYIDNVTINGTLNAPGDLGISVVTTA